MLRKCLDGDPMFGPGARPVCRQRISNSDRDDSRSSGGRLPGNWWPQALTVPRIESGCVGGWSAAMPPVTGSTSCRVAGGFAAAILPDNRRISGGSENRS